MYLYQWDVTNERVCVKCSSWLLMLSRCFSQHNWMICSFFAVGTRVFCFLMWATVVLQFPPALFLVLFFPVLHFQYLELVLHFPPVYFGPLFYLVLLIPVLHFQSTPDCRCHAHVIVHVGSHSMLFSVTIVHANWVRRHVRYCFNYKGKMNMDQLHYFSEFCVFWITKKAKLCPTVTGSPRPNAHW